MSRFFALLVRWAGGRPHVVLPLAKALEQAAEGHSDLLRERNPRRVLIPPRALRLLGVVFGVLSSVVLAALFLLKMPEGHPHPLVVVIAVMQWIFTVVVVTAQAGPALLLTDDVRLLGGWPLSRREIVLARLLTILRPALLMAAALGGLPLLAAAFAMRPLLLQAVSFGFGLLVQAVGVAFGVTVLSLLGARWLGPRRAERLAGLLGDGNVTGLVFLIYLPVRAAWSWIEAHPDVLYVVPPGWILALGDWRSGPTAWLWAGIGLAFQVLLVTAGLRLLVDREQGQRITEAAPRASGGSPLDLPVRLLAPLLPGREGRVVARLFTAHLRDDWRFLGAVAAPLVLLAGMSGIFGNMVDAIDPAQLSRTALASVPMIQLYIMLVVLAIMSTQSSSRPEAIWLVALGDLDGARVLGSVRRLILLLMGGPALAVFAVMALRVGASWPVVLRDLAVMGLEMEICLLLVQPLVPWLPFSTPFAQNQMDQRLVGAIAASVLSFAPVALNLAYAHVAGFRWPLWLGLPVVWWLAHRRFHRKLDGTRLHADVVMSTPG